MERDDICRACNVNMRVAGTYAHCSVLFERRSKPQSVAERLKNIGLTVTPDINKSDRICPRCVTTLTRLERDMPVFQEWEREFAGAQRSTALKVDWFPTKWVEFPRLRESRIYINQLLARACVS